MEGSRPITVISKQFHLRPLGHTYCPKPNRTDEGFRRPFGTLGRLHGWILRRFKPPILASLLKCYGAAQSNVSAGSCQDPNSSLTNDSDDDADDATDDDDVDDDGDGGDGAVSQTGSPSCAC